MHRSVRNILFIVITVLVSGCNGNSNHSSNRPTSPKPIEPGASYPIVEEIGDVTLVGMSESVVVRDIVGIQQRVRIESFKGIPYAQAERFEHSKTERLDDGYATDFGPICPQLILSEKTQDEDCLSLNIWRPSNLQAGQKVPVYVYIHGGNFEYGSGADRHIHGDNVVAQGQLDDEPFIAITFNYRLGLLGSAYSSSDEGGNFGIGDQKRALQWVNENIDKFGGNPSDVTLMGQGAGAMSIGILQQYESEDYVGGRFFQKAIMQSNPYGFQYRSSRSAESFAKVSDLRDLKLKEVLSLQLASSNTTAKVANWAASSLNPISQNNTPMPSLVPFAPYIEYRSRIGADFEGYHVKSQPFVSDLSVPTVAGFNSADERTFASLAGITFLIPAILEVLQDTELTENSDAEYVSERVANWLSDDANLARLSAHILSIDLTDINEQLAIIDAIDRLPDSAYEVMTILFYGIRNINKSNELLSFEDYKKNSEYELAGAYSNMKQFNQLTNDMLFAAPIRSLLTRAASSQIQVTMYEFNYRASFNSVVRGNLFNDKETDVIQIIKYLSCSLGSPCFGSELPFVFNKAFRADGSEFSVSQRDEEMMNRMSRHWFSPELFKKESYNPSLDNVWVIDGLNVNQPIYDWDQATKFGKDKDFIDGRLTGLERLGMVGYYLVD
ncbi:carboxylesterase family protein [Vibrio sp. ER1A]|uniref:carboxylesterase family protein n=1 Tax=Vibrio sp. ER1A TaxID=1517681 RepID=UPI0004DD5219|nr:carboxylesterase family protein [Vibrio sp. ER1A]KFA95755.1 hypothetical protein HW45_25725 [Vibrio sp. ER1A]